MTVIILLGMFGGIAYLFNLLYLVLRKVFRPRKLKTFPRESTSVDSTAQPEPKGGEQL